jgi:hypothetical protein
MDDLSLWLYHKILYKYNFKNVEVMCKNLFVLQS